MYFLMSTDVPENKHPARLANKNHTAGRVEIFYNGEWGTVCDDGWTMENARVVCRSLGFPGVWSFDTSYGRGDGLIWLDDVNCSGSEPFLDLCGHAPVSEHNCAHHEDVGVSCMGTYRL